MLKKKKKRKRKIQGYLLKHGKQTLRGGCRNQCKDHWNEILQWGRETGLNSKYSMGKWECTAKKQGVRGQWVGNYLQETSEVRGTLAGRLE